MSPRVVVIGAGLSNPSSTTLLADRLASAVTRAAAGRGGVRIERIELRPLAHALADHLLTGFPGGDLAAAIETVRAADALIVVTPVFSASYSGLFKTFFDVLEPGTIDGTPTIIAATAGSARHQLVLDHALRPLLSYLRAVVMPTGVFAAAEDFGSAGLDQRIDRAAGELMNAMPTSGSNGSGSIEFGSLGSPLRDEFADPTPFAALLREASGNGTR